MYEIGKELVKDILLKAKKVYVYVCVYVINIKYFNEG